MLKPAKWLAPFRRHTPCAKCRLCVEFTGAQAENPSEALIESVAGGQRTVPLHWLEERIADALYNAELGKSGGATDIGLWGCMVFCTESARMIADMRPEFAVVREKEQA